MHFWEDPLVSVKRRLQIYWYSVGRNWSQGSYYAQGMPCVKLLAPSSVPSLFFIFRPKGDKSIGLGQDFRFNRLLDP